MFEIKYAYNKSIPSYRSTIIERGKYHKLYIQQISERSRLRTTEAVMDQNVKQGTDFAMYFY